MAFGMGQALGRALVDGWMFQVAVGGNGLKHFGNNAPPPAEGVGAERPNPLRQRPTAALGLDLQQAGHLHGRPQEDGIKHLLPGMPRRQISPRFRTICAKLFLPESREGRVR